MSLFLSNYKKQYNFRFLKIKAFFFLFCIVLFFLFSFASPAKATLFAPGATLEPDCPPTESLETCGVIAPLTLTGTAQDLTLARIGASTFSTLQEMQNVFHSAGWTSGGEITDAGGGTINIAAGTGLIRSANLAISTISYFDWDASNGIVIPNNSIRYIGLEYNDGTPQISLRLSSNWNLRTDFSIGVVVNENGNLSIYSDTQAVGDHAANMIQREYETMPLSRDERNGGLLLDETGARNITVSTGAVWDRLNRYVISDIDTSAGDTFSAYYMDGAAGFTKVIGLTQWPNTQYDDGDGTLATMTDDYFATLWFYVDTNGEISMLYGMGEYSTASLADAEMAPENIHLPDRLSVFGKLLGKVIFQKGGLVAADVSTAFSMHGVSGLTGNHGNLTGLDFISSGHTGFAMSGVNTNITSLTGLSTALSPGQGGTGLSSYSSGDLLYASDDSTLSKLNIGIDGQVLKVSGGLLTWGTDTNLGNTNLTLSGARGLSLNGNSLTIDGSTGDVVFADNGNMTVGGDLTITGDDLFLGTNTLGALLVADGTNFNPVVVGGDASLDAAGALTLNYNAAQSASAINKGFLTAADWTIFNNKQSSLGFTAEDSDNKSTDVGLGNSDVLYPTQNAVKTYVDDKELGLVWHDPLELINVIADRDTPETSPEINDAYIINTGGDTDDWAAFAPGDLIQYQEGLGWVLIKSLVVGDNFGISFKSDTVGYNAFAGKDDYLVHITGGAPGSFVYTFESPNNNDAAFVNNINAFYNGISFTYSTHVNEWVQLSGQANYSFSDGLSVLGTDVSLGALTSDWTQSGAFDIITAGDIYVDGGDLKTTNNTATLFNTNATTLNIGGSATTIGLGAAGATVSGIGALTLNSGANTALTLDSGTTGVLNLGTGNNAKTINIGTGISGNTIQIGTNNSVQDTISIGSALDALSLTSTGLNLTSGGALTGVASINTVTHSATAITFAGAGTLSSTGVNTLTVDSGTTGAINLGTGANAKTITIGNTTGATALNLQSGTGNISLQIAGIATTGKVQVGAGGVGSATPDLFGLDIKSTAGDPIGTNGVMYYNSNTNKFRCYENGAWTNCITSPGTDLQHVTSYDSNESLTNISAVQTTLGTVSITPSSATGDIYVTGQADVLSSNNRDQTFVLTIETGATCTGATVGNATRSYTISAAAGTDRGTLIVSGIAVDPGAAVQAYSLCASTATGDTDVMDWRMEAMVIDTGADLAEIYTTNDEILEAGDLVSLDQSLKTGVKKSENISDKNVLGIVSTKPGMLIGGVDGEGVQAVPVALSGRVPVKVTSENGAIEPGDYLGPSSIPGVAMKSNGTGVVIGQALSSFNNTEVGMVLVFVKNFDLGTMGDMAVLLGDVTAQADVDGEDNGLASLLATLQSESIRDPVLLLGQKIADGKQILTDFMAARISAVRGYFDEIFAQKIHTEQLCVKKTDGSEVCVNGDQLDILLENDGITPTQESVPDEDIPNESATSTPEVSTSSPDESDEFTSIEQVTPEEDIPSENTGENTIREQVPVVPSEQISVEVSESPASAPVEEPEVIVNQPNE